MNNTWTRKRETTSVKQEGQPWTIERMGKEQGLLRKKEAEGSWAGGITKGNPERNGVVRKEGSATV